MDGRDRRGRRAAGFALVSCLALAAVCLAHEHTGKGGPTGRPDLDYIKAKIAEAKALDAIGHGGFDSGRAYIPQCVFRFAGCIGGCSSEETACYVVAYPDDAKRTNYSACVDTAHRCRLRCCDLACAKELKIDTQFPCDF